MAVWVQDEARLDQQATLTRLRARKGTRPGGKPGAHAVPVLDGAARHGARALAVPPNIALMTLPPYSPEPNPVENVRQFLRQNRPANRGFDSCEAVIDVCCKLCCKAWNAFVETPERVTSIASQPWAKVNARCRWDDATCAVADEKGPPARAAPPSSTEMAG